MFGTARNAGVKAKLLLVGVSVNTTTVRRRSARRRAITRNRFGDRNGQMTGEFEAKRAVFAGTRTDEREGSTVDGTNRSAVESEI